MPENKRETDLISFDPPVFYTSTAVLLVLVVGAALWPDATSELFQAMQNGIVENASWYYVLVVAIILFSVLILSVTRLGDIKLGPDHAEPDYSLISWFAMLFSAGMGIGLMFFGVAEPVMHFLTPPRGDPGTVDAAREAMKLSFFHWGVHAWAMYAIVALILAYFGFRHQLPLTLRSALYPLIGERIYGPIGTAVDVFAIIGTVCGVATSLGFGVLQINSGLAHLFDIPSNTTVQVILIVVTTGLATISVVLGLDVGIKRLSEINIVLAFALLVAVLSLGPTILLMQAFVQNTGSYISEIVDKTFNLYAYDPTDWMGGWTIFYWGWWMSWSPFVGLFIARISRGRTIREFVIGAMIGPTLFTLLWMTIFGNSAINLIMNEGITELGEAVQADSSVALFMFFENFPMSELLSFVAVIMVIVFFVTSADSGAMVVNMLSSHGQDNTPIAQRIFWTATIGIIAIVLLLAGGLPSLQTAAIASAFPFSFALLAAIWGFTRALRTDRAKRDALSTHNAADTHIPWQERLNNLFQYPSVEGVRAFQAQFVLPVLGEFASELEAKGIKTELVDDREERVVRLEVYHGDELDFSYTVYANEQPLPDAALVGRAIEELEDSEKYCRAEVHLREGGQDYDVMGWTREQLANDVLDQYERHLHY
ncbi:MAG: BCCT family transporter, partial [Pseudomonadales bacterium]